jgi:aminoglycoside phosphotransferase (APT) family kinase protein
VSYSPSQAEVEALGAFLAARGLTGPDISLSRIGDGHANLTYLATERTRSVVVRRPPPPPLPPGANDVLREASTLAAVGRAGGVPVPEILATGEAGDVFDVPFFVMSLELGEVAGAGLPWGWQTEAFRRDVSFAVADGLAGLHRIDWRETGLRGRPDGANLRQRDRLALLVAAWLVEHAPAESAHAVIHGDYRIGNLIVGSDEPRLVAVLDWELATVGDPLVDLGYLVATWAEVGGDLTPIEELGAVTANPGFATKAELAARYFDAVGRPAQDLAWYVALAHWKLAVLYEYSRRRFETGDGDPYYADPALVESFLGAARRAAGL